MVEGLKEFFEELDRRVDKTGKRGNKSLYEILMVTMCGVAANGKSIGKVKISAVKLANKLS